MAVVRKLIPALAVTLFCAMPAGAQDVGRITGQVVDSATHQGLSSVSIMVEGTSRGAVAKTDGTFEITDVPAGTYTVRARRIGYHNMDQSVTVTAGGTTNVTLAMEPQPAMLTEIVSTGYGTQRREAITGSVATVQADQANVGVIANATELIQGRAAGVQMITSSGEPGGNVQLRIRGGTSISASNDPLYVIDGVPLQNTATTPDASGAGYNAALARNPLNSINPNDIESMTILKDASATAIYGSRGANGVILITTKRGQRESQIEYETFVGMARPASTLGLASGEEYRQFVIANKDSLGGQTAVDALGSANTDWEKELTQTGLAMSHNLSFTGGSSQTKYRASLNYFDQEGVILNNGLRRYQGRLNATHDALDSRVRLTLNLMASRVNNRYAPNENGGGFTGGLFTNMVIFDPTKPVKNADGSFYEVGTGAVAVRNPVAMAEQISDVAPENRLLGNATATLQLMEGLTSQTTLGADNTQATRRFYAPKSNPIGAAYGGFARQADRSLQNLNFQQLLTWTPQLGADHEFEIVGGYEYTKEDNQEFDAATQAFITDAYGVDNLFAGTQVPSGYPYSWHTESTLVSYFTRANYGFAGKYFLTGVLRRDGSSRLAPGHQWEVFPALSASWRLSEESFMSNRPFGLSNLSIRAGWGKQGNQSVQPYQTQLLLKSDPGALYPFGGVVTSGLAAAQVGNPNLKWETATQTNIGVDYGFMDDRITGGLEIYQKNTKDLLLERSVPQPAVVSSRIENVGSLRNRGFEANLDAQLYSKGRTSLSGGLVLTIERNQVTSLGDTTAACANDETTQSYAAMAAAKCSFIKTGMVQGQGQSDQWSQIIMRGQAIGTFMVPVFVGVENGQQMFACTAATNAACVNGKSTAPTEADRAIVGTANPDFTVGLRNNATWGDFDASWLWRGEFGGQVLNNTALVYLTKSDAAQGRNFLKGALTIPDNVHEPAKLSTRWLEDRTFVRLQNVTVGYTLPASLTKGHATRVYLSGDNLLLFTGYSGYDPEVFVDLGLASRGIDYLTYPPTRTITIGAHTTF